MAPNTFDPTIHNRKSLRLTNYDYSSTGFYFITICCWNRFCWFGHIEDKNIFLNRFGQIATEELTALSNHFANLRLDTFQIMPNHIHAIFELNDCIYRATARVAPTDNILPAWPNVISYPVDRQDTFPSVGAGLAPAQTNNSMITHTNTITPVGVGLAPTQDSLPQILEPISIGDIVGAYKSLVANSCLEIYKAENKFLGKLWQRNYYEHIIRNEKSYNYIVDYIKNNPANWENDKLYKE